MKRTIQNILNDLINMLATHERITDFVLLDVLYSICTYQQDERVVTFPLDEISTNRAMAKIEEYLKNTCATYPKLSQTISYLLDELTCNIQQHSHAERGLLFSMYNPDEKLIELILADHGISIYGSYVRAQKYLDMIGNSDAEALGLAKDGYSTKNLPNAENRGYGISSNTKMITEGLNGEIAIYSGTALFVKSQQDTKLLELPEQLDVKGTIVVARIPIDVPTDYDFYKYIS